MVGPTKLLPCNTNVSGNTIFTQSQKLGNLLLIEPLQLEEQAGPKFWVYWLLRISVPKQSRKQHLEQPYRYLLEVSLKRKRT